MPGPALQKQGEALTGLDEAGSGLGDVASSPAADDAAQPVCLSPSIVDLVPDPDNLLGTAFMWCGRRVLPTSGLLSLAVGPRNSGRRPSVRVPGQGGQIASRGSADDARLCDGGATRRDPVPPSGASKAAADSTQDAAMAWILHQVELLQERVCGCEREDALSSARWEAPAVKQLASAGGWQDTILVVRFRRGEMPIAATSPQHRRDCVRATASEARAAWDTADSVRQAVPVPFRQEEGHSFQSRPSGSSAFGSARSMAYRSGLPRIGQPCPRSCRLASGWTSTLSNRFTWAPSRFKQSCTLCSTPTFSLRPRSMRNTGVPYGPCVSAGWGQGAEAEMGIGGRAAASQAAAGAAASHAPARPPPHSLAHHPHQLGGCYLRAWAGQGSSGGGVRTALRGVPNPGCRTDLPRGRPGRLADAQHRDDSAVEARPLGRSAA